MRTQKIALVTGATAGIGRAVALRLAADGLEVIAHGRDAERGALLVTEIAELGGRARFVAADLSVTADVLALAEAAGEVDVLVNNAAVFEFTSTPDTPAESFDRHVAINTRAPFLLVGALAPGMVARGYGSIVNISSTAATSPTPVGAVYGASKAAIDLLTRSWAAEFGGHGVRVNAVSPGPTRTPGAETLFGEKLDALDHVNARGRIGDPEEIAAIVGFLVGEASSYVNGSVVVANGGERSALPA